MSTPKTAAMISQKPLYMNGRVAISLLYDGFFSFAVVRQIIRFMIGSSVNKGEVSVNSHIAFRPYAQNLLVLHQL